MTNSRNSRLRTAIKRSVHFVLTDSFADSIKGVGKNFSREFWRYLDDQNSTTRKVIFKKAWNVWVDSGEDVLSANFTQGSLIVVTKRGQELAMSLKETVGAMTELNKVQAADAIEGDENSVENDKMFEKVWNKLSSFNGEYPSNYRPLSASVAQLISARTGAPLPVVCAAINKKFMPSEISNGFAELSKKSMPKEVFDETLVNAAIRDGIAERVGPESNFTFKVKRDHYREWVARTEATRWRDVEAVPDENVIEKNLEKIESEK